MNGWTPAIPVEKRIQNLLEQVPTEYHYRAGIECHARNLYDIERKLTAYVLGRVWETYPHAVDEAQRIEREIDAEWQSEMEARHAEWLDWEKQKAELNPAGGC